jgi:Lrp/AsnC family leucine-responsive transcriptional regulator
MIDEIDKQILMLLQVDGSLSNAAIAEEVGLTASSVYERVKKLENKGIITGYVAVVDAEAVGKTITAFIRLTVGARAGEDYVTAKYRFMELCLAESDVLECHGVAGADCYVLKVRVAHPKALEKLVERLRNNAMITSSVSSIVLTTFKETTAVVPE